MSVPSLLYAPLGARHEGEGGWIRLEPYWILDPIRFPKKGGRVREDRDAGYGECLSPFGRCFNALKLPYRAGHLVRSLGIHIPYKRTLILVFRLSFLWATKAIRICEGGEPYCCCRRLPLLLLRKRRVLTHFYEERETLQKDSRFIGRTFFFILFPDHCSTSKDPFFLCEKTFRSVLQDLPRYKIYKP